MSDLRWAMRRRLMDILDKKNCGDPRTHENGFIQLDLDFPWRLHVWPEHGRGFKKQATDSPIHNHMWGFRSWTLYGRIHDVGYDVIPTRRLDSGDKASGFLHEFHVVKEGKLHSVQDFCLAHRRTRHTIAAGGTYRMEAGVFHASEWDDLAVTIICRDAPTKQFVRVLCPYGQVPDNSFDRATANPLHVLWDYIWRGVHAALREEKF